MKSFDAKAGKPATHDEEEGDLLSDSQFPSHDLGGKLLFVKPSIISVLILGQRILDKRRLGLKSPCFQVPRHEGGSPNDVHNRKTRKG